MAHRSADIREHGPFATEIMRAISMNGLKFSSRSRIHVSRKRERFA